MLELIEMQGTMFILIFAGYLIKKIGLIGEEGQRNITDLVIYLILPCNIVKSFMVEFSMSILTSFGVIFLISIGIQLVCTVLGKVLYPMANESEKKCLYYATVCSNAGFLGNPVAEGVFGSIGLTMASIYLIPQRIVMWSAGVAAFTESPDKKTLWKKVLTHPCILACFLGLILMITQYQPPVFITKALQSLSSCNTALSMMVIGMILAQVDLRTLWNKKVIYYTVIRLVFIPLLVFIPCSLLPVDQTVMGVSVLLAAMPAGATTSILASKYDGDAVFATKIVVCSTFASLLSTPIWSFLLL